MQADKIERRQAVVARLLELQQKDRPTTRAVEFAARSLGVSERSVWRWLSDACYQPGSRQGWETTDEAIEALYLTGGRPVVAWRTLGDAGTDVPSKTVFCAAVKRDVSLAELAYMRSGENGRRRYSIYRLWAPEARNEVWEADHALLDVEILAPGFKRPLRPWMTAVIDGYSRVLMAWTLSVGPPTVDHVLTVIEQAIRVEPSRGPWGGVPDLIRFDGGKEFLANAVTQAAGELGCLALPTLPYSPHHKGKIERMHRTIRDGLIASLPHYTGGARKANGKLYAQGRHLTLDELVNLIFAFEARYNHIDKHSSIRTTPARQWGRSQRPLDLVEPQHLRWMLMAAKPKKVSRQGINFGGDSPYWAPELAGVVGTTVQVRYRPHDPRQIEVFTDAGWLCTATPQDQATPEEVADVVREREELNREMSQRAAAARRKARRRFSPVVPGQPIEEIPVIIKRGRSTPAVTDERVEAALRLLGHGNRINRTIPAPGMQTRD
jgi:putative transposase